MSVAELEASKLVIVRALQTSFFAEELPSLKRWVVKGGKRVSAIRKLDPFVDPDGLIRVGGRLQRSGLEYAVRHPLLLPSPSKCQVSRLLVQHMHEKAQHQGRHFTSSLLRSSGFWVLGSSTAIRSVLNECYFCKRLYSSPQGQKMAELPSDRVSVSSVFSYTGVDLFGPFLVKQGRSSVKRYVALFTCLASRAVHLEVVSSMSTDAFINALRRLVAIRGPIRCLRSDRGTNFVGASNEIRESQVRSFLQKHGCDLVDWKFNVPKSSHFGGVWERQIRSARRILASILEQSSGQLDDEGLRTVMYEVSAIINSRPLTSESVNDCTAPLPISPANLLTGKSEVTLLPPGEFQESDLFCRKHWRRVQYLLNVFWSRWRKEYLHTLQSRQKWLSPSRNLQVGDVVLIKDDLAPRSQWSLAKVVAVFPGQDGFVRSARLLVGSPSLDKDGRRTSSLSYLERPVHKLVLLVKASADTD